MISFAPCKINIGLKVLNKRKDGFHNIESYLYPIPLYDILEIAISNKDELIQTGIVSTIKMENNLVYKAILLLRKEVQFPPVKIHLHKQIPVQAGLGGGSSNAMTTLKLIISFFGLPVSSDLLMKLAIKLGSDCPFFINSNVAKIEGRGEKITPLNFSLKGKYIMLVKPSFSINTSNAFLKFKNNEEKALPHIPNLELNKWQKDVYNDFEINLEKKHKEIKIIKTKLLEQGAFYASLSGSGSTVFGVFNSEKVIKFNPSYFTWFGTLQ